MHVETGRKKVARNSICRSGRVWFELLLENYGSVLAGLSANTHAPPLKMYGESVVESLGSEV